MTDVQPFILTALILGLSIACYTDLRWYRIPNWLTFSLMLFALLCHLASKGLKGLLFSLGGMLLGAAILGVFHALGKMGAGDVKLMGAVGSVLGPTGVFYAFVFTGIAGGIYALLVALAQFNFFGEYVYRLLSRPVEIPAGAEVEEVQFSPAAGRMPITLAYGAAISTGTIAYILMDILAGWPGTGLKFF